jgi:hypothetical protein
MIRLMMAVYSKSEMALIIVVDSNPSPHPCHTLPVSDVYTWWYKLMDLIIIIITFLNF